MVLILLNDPWSEKPGEMLHSTGPASVNWPCTIVPCYKYRCVYLSAGRISPNVRLFSCAYVCMHVCTHAYVCMHVRAKKKKGLCEGVYPHCHSAAVGCDRRSKDQTGTTRNCATDKRVTRPRISPNHPYSFMYCTMLRWQIWLFLGSLLLYCLCLEGGTQVGKGKIYEKLFFLLYSWLSSIDFIRI